METLRKLLDAECSFRMQEETKDRFFALMTEVELKKNEILVPYGDLDNSVYVIKSGLVRVGYFNGFKEMTYGFGGPGTMFTSFYPFYQHDPSFFKFEVCCDSVVMKIPKAKFVELTKESVDFAQWVMWMFAAQLWLDEKKLAIVNGDAKERYEALVKNRPEIIENVSEKHIASYIGITRQHLFRLKKQLSQ
jgi:CRP-like cAMP-binding protein